ncbi:MAG TPA: GlsB/YeaQ/YmgE family stress response membrane protein [Gaiellaceae bacterium]|nr:GlsB/YeaQ/YmgE family stress response membrane protein [Gaiellaceae bacterium]
MVATISFWGFLWYVIAGLVIGLLARALLPGRQHLSLVVTILLGIASGIVGGLIWDAIFTNHGIAWIGSVIVAMVALYAYQRLAASRART